MLWPARFMPVRQSPQFSRSAAIEGLKARIESADALEPGGQGRLRGRQIRLVDQRFREVQPPRLEHSHWGCAEMLQKQPAELARADSQAPRQILERLFGEPCFINQPQGARNRG